MKKSIEKLKVRIDQNLNRAEKSELLNEDLLRIEEKVIGLKQVCHSVSKKLSEGNNKGNDGAAIEKRIRKTTDFIVGQTIQENGRLFTRKDESSFLGTLLSDSGHLLNDLAANQIRYEIEVEKLVIQQLQVILENSWPPISKEKRVLERHVSDLDRVKSRLLHVKSSNASSSSSSTSSSAGPVEDPAAILREERLQEELYEIQSKVDASRDSLASLMLQFLAKEPEIGRILLTYFQVKKDYHAHVSEQISKQVTRFQSVINSCPTPVYGCDLKNHLNRSGRIVAVPLQLCICRLIHLGLEEEGIFRVAASSGKIKHLKALFDAGEWGGNTLLQIEDHHVFAGALKTYLRELPTPLIQESYETWLEFGKQTGQNPRLKDLVQKLPLENQDNLNYLFQFLNLIASKSTENKMNTSNLSIVMAPNLIWNPETVETVNGISDTTLVNGVVQTLIENVDWYFENPDVDFFDGVLISGSSVSMSERTTVQSLKRSLTTHRPHLNSNSSPRAPIPTPRGSKHPGGKPVIPAKPNLDIKSVQQESKQAAESTNL